MFTLNNKILHAIQPKLTDQLASLLINLKQKSYQSIINLLLNISIDCSEIYSVRFGVLLIEFFHEWKMMTGQKIGNTYFQIKWELISRKIPVHKINYYLYADCDSLYQSDLEFLRDCLPEMLCILPKDPPTESLNFSFSRSCSSQKSNIVKNVFNESIKNGLLSEHEKNHSQNEQSANKWVRPNQQKVSKNETVLKTGKNESKQKENSAIVLSGIQFSEKEVFPKSVASFYVQSKFKNKVVKELKKQKKKTEFLKLNDFLSVLEMENLITLESIFIERKLLLHEIFKTTVILEVLYFLKEDIEKMLVDQFDKIRYFIISNNKNIEEYQNRLIYETKFFKSFLALFEARNIATSQSSENFRSFKIEVVDLIQSLFGSVPNLYQNSKNIFPKIINNYDKFESEYSNSQVSCDFADTLSFKKQKENSNKSRQFSFSMDREDADYSGNTFVESRLNPSSKNFQNESVFSFENKIQFSEKNNKQDLFQAKKKVLDGFRQIAFSRLTDKSKPDSLSIGNSSKNGNSAIGKNSRIKSGKVEISFQSNISNDTKFSNQNDSSFMSSVQNERQKNRHEIQETLNYSFICANLENAKLKESGKIVQDYSGMDSIESKMIRQPEIEDDEYYKYLKSTYNFELNLKGLNLDYSTLNVKTNNYLNRITEKSNGGILKNKKQNLMPKISDIEFKYKQMKESFLKDYSSFLKEEIDETNSSSFFGKIKNN